MPSSQTLTKVTLKCKECSDLSVEIPNPESITESDGILLNRYLDQSDFTAEEKARLTELLGGTPVCPNHGATALGYETEFQFTAYEDFILDMEPKKPSLPMRIRRFVARLLFRS